MKLILQTFVALLHEGVDEIRFLKDVVELDNVDARKEVLGTFQDLRNLNLLVKVAFVGWVSLGDFDADFLLRLQNDGLVHPALGTASQLSAVVDLVDFFHNSSICHTNL